MAQKTINPYGTNGQAASGLGIVDNLVDGGQDKALSAEMGKELNDRLEVLETYHGFRHRIEFSLFDATIPNGTPTIVDNGSFFSIVVTPQTDYTITSAIGTMVNGTLTKTEKQDGSVMFSTDNVVGNINIFVVAIPDELVGIKMSLKMSKSYIADNPTILYNNNERWNYRGGLLLRGMLGVYDAYSNDNDVSDLLAYAKKYYHDCVNSGGIVGGVWGSYAKSNYDSDQVQPAFNLFRLKQLDSDQAYAANGGYYDNVISTLVDQLADQPRLAEPTDVVGTKGHPYQHKANYAYQHWLDGDFMVQPFRTLYASTSLSGQTQVDAYNDIVGQLVNSGVLTYDSETKLYRHAFSGQGSSATWADSNGQSYYAWGRALGWHIMALCEVLDILPTNHSRRMELVDILTGLLIELQKYKDDGVWHLLPTVDTTDIRNDFEATSSCMFAYGYLHGARMGYLPESMKQIAKNVYESVLDKFVEINGASVTLKKCVTGGNPGGTSTTKQQVLENYYSKSFADNDLHGVGPFIMASLEYELLFNN